MILDKFVHFLRSAVQIVHCTGNMHVEYFNDSTFIRYEFINRCINKHCRAVLGVHFKALCSVVIKQTFTMNINMLQV